MMATPNDWDVSAVQMRLRSFADDRDWDQFHSPKNLAMALSVEAAELLEIFQWLTPQESAELTPDQRLHLEEELADVLIYAIRLADVAAVSLPDVVDRKIERNELKYPVEDSRGNAERRRAPEARDAPL
jgi:NTP pyrophosphatase (non-canonical NTP hydrolase)